MAAMREAGVDQLDNFDAVFAPLNQLRGGQFGPASLGAGGFAPAGAFGGFKKPGTPSGWVGDNSKSVQIKKFEEGSDYLFFQGPAPKTAVQEGLPSFLSAETISEAEFQGPLQIVVTLTGLGSFAALAYLLVTG